MSGGRKLQGDARWQDLPAHAAAATRPQEYSARCGSSRRGVNLSGIELLPAYDSEQSTRDAGRAGPTPAQPRSRCSNDWRNPA
jgi:hypothetical protein